MKGERQSCRLIGVYSGRGNLREHLARSHAAIRATAGRNFTALAVSLFWLRVFFAEALATFCTDMAAGYPPHYVYSWCWQPRRAT